MTYPATDARKRFFRSRVALALTAAALTVLGIAPAAVLAGCGGGESATNGQPSAADTHPTPTRTKVFATKVRPSVLVSKPRRYYGRRVTFLAKVSRRMDHRVWEMANGRIFAIYDPGLAQAATEGEKLRITGKVWPLRKRVIEQKVGVNIEDHFFSDGFLRDDVAVVASAAMRLGGGKPQKTSPPAIVSDPSRYYGKKVTFVATVSNEIDHHVWEMADNRIFAVYFPGLARAASRGERLRITGKVAPLDQRVIERKLGADIEDRFYSISPLRDDVAIVVYRTTRLSG